MDTIFILMMWITGGAILVSIITALIGLFTKNTEQKNKFFALSSKSILICFLAFIVGFGACLA